MDLVVIFYDDCTDRYPFPCISINVVPDIYTNSPIGFYIDIRNETTPAFSVHSRRKIFLYLNVVPIFITLFKSEVVGFTMNFVSGGVTVDLTAPSS